MQSYDLIIIGASPAGMAAAAEACARGASVLVLEEQPGPGGQIYRNIGAGARPWLGKTYAKGAHLVQDFTRHRVKALYGATVWSIEAGGTVAWSQQGVSTVSHARHVLICTGAQERPMPFQGWTLPGVMPAGAAQILMKSSGMIPNNAVLAGCGPLLYQIAVQMIDAGAPPLALVETQSAADLRTAARHLPAAAMRATGLMVKGLGFLRRIRIAGVPRYRGAKGLEATAQDGGRITLDFNSGGQRRQLECNLLLTHQGLIPSTVLSRAAGIPHEWNPAQQSLQPVADDWGRTHVPGLWLAGDGAGIAGAEAAEAAGRLAALAILCEAGKLSAQDRDQLAATPRKHLRCALAIRPFLDAAYPPATATQPLADAVIACRCEEITCGTLRTAIREGADGFRKIKTATRAGMGPCQGRMCDPTIRALLTEDGRNSVSDDSPRARWPAKPITLGELAALETAQSDQT